MPGDRQGPRHGRSAVHVRRWQPDRRHQPDFPRRDEHVFHQGGEVVRTRLRCVVACIRAVHRSTQPRRCIDRRLCDTPGRAEGRVVLSEHEFPRWRSAQPATTRDCRVHSAAPPTISRALSTTSIVPGKNRGWSGPPTTSRTPEPVASACSPVSRLATLRTAAPARVPMRHEFDLTVDYKFAQGSALDGLSVRMRAAWVSGRGREREWCRRYLRLSQLS